MIKPKLPRSKEEIEKFRDQAFNEFGLVLSYDDAKQMMENADRDGEAQDRR